MRRPRPPQETPVVACHQEWSREVTTEGDAHRATLEGGKQVVVQEVAVDAHVVHEAWTRQHTAW